MKLWPHQERAIALSRDCYAKGDQAWCLTAPCGAGKCLGAGTPVIMFNGMIKMVEDVRYGDRLMGPDSLPRTVIGTTWGSDMLYRVTPKRSGDSYVVNGSHLISLKMGKNANHSCRRSLEDGQIVNITASDYIAENQTFKAWSKGWKTGVDFPERFIALDPYLFGLWLGDGHSKSFAITTADQEVVDCIYSSASSYGVDVKVYSQQNNAASTYAMNNGRGGGRDDLREAWLSLVVKNDKHIPLCYKANTRDIRLKLLAGIIDSDGHTGKNGFDIVFKSELLARDVVFLARSLGFSVSFRPCVKMCCNNGVVGQYWRMHITGDTEMVPVRIPRKKCRERRQIKNHLLSAIQVQPIGEGPYYGFEVDSDGLFMLGDFTVTHNSKIQQQIALPAADKGKHVCLYTHRIMLTRQTINSFLKTGVEFGVVANGFEEYKKPDAKIQICSLDTVFSRMGNWRHEFPRADIVIVDEAHQQTAEKAKAVFGRHKSEGAKQIGFTATPVDLGGMYQRLVSAGTYSEMLGCNAHLPVHCYGPDRPDTSSIKPMKSGDFSQESDRKINRVPTIIGRVYEYWQKLNPSALPAVGFAPGVDESKWFVDEFKSRGVPCGHIDGERVVMVEKGLNGVLATKEYRTDDSSREAILEGSRSGLFKIVWSRFVLREAVDCPFWYHAIFATSVGSVASWLQMAGRVQRFWPEYDHVLIVDHGGNLDRHDPPDIDRDWELGCTANSVHKAEVEKKRKKSGDDAEPICCPNCSGYRLSGPVCPYCQYMHKRSVRMVRQLDGTLSRKTGRNVKHKAAKGFDDYLRSAIYAGWCNGLTVKQAYWIAKKKASINGVKGSATSIHTPSVGSGDWHKSCREIYPNMKPKQFENK